MHHSVKHEAKDVKQKFKRSASSDIAKATKVRRTGGGGAWRAFVHHRLAGQKLSGTLAQELKDQYASMSMDEREYYRKLGSAGVTPQQKQFWEHQMSFFC